MSSVLAALQVKIGADVKGLEKSLKRTDNRMNQFNKKMNGIGTALAGVFAVGEVISFGKEVIAVTGKFERLNAVLSNALGSDSSAELAFQRIQDFASKTPFQIEELTGSFVKLVGQGIRPTMDQMRNLGDLAASQGKGFDQLAEGILDATTMEFERLKEFGIRAKKSGDQVQFTFKGVTTTVEATDKAIEQYIYSLGETEGVQGSMADISDTLGGKISNLQDVFTQFQANLGKMNSGVLKNTIDYFIKLGDAANQVISTDFADRVVSKESIIKAEERLSLLQNRLEEILKENEKVKNMTYGEAKSSGEDPQFISQDGINKVISAIERQKEVIAQLKQEEQDLAKATKDREKAATQAAAQAESEKGILGRLNDSLKKIKELRDTSNSQAEIKAYNSRAEKIDREIKKLKELGKFKELPQIASIGFQTFELPEIKIPEIDTSNLDTLSTKLEGVKEQTFEVGHEISGMLAGVANSVGQALGNMLADTSGFENFGDNILNIFGTFLTQLGQMAIAMGTAVAAVQFSGNPFAMIAGGIAAVAIGTAISKAVSKGPGIPQSPALGPDARPGSGLERKETPFVVQGDWRASGTDLMLVMKNQERKNRRTGG